MDTHTQPHKHKTNDKKLSQAEAGILADWLREQGVEVKAASSLWKLRPSQVARMFKLDHGDILKAVRRMDE